MKFDSLKNKEIIKEMKIKTTINKDSTVRIPTRTPKRKEGEKDKNNNKTKDPSKGVQTKDQGETVKV